MKIKAAIWDLDGTLLNTLDDLAISTNEALKANGLPVRTTDEVRRFVGNGVHKLIERAVPEMGEATSTRSACTRPSRVHGSPLSFS